jgi:hypothetical protein
MLKKVYAMSLENEYLYPSYLFRSSTFLTKTATFFDEITHSSVGLKYEI